MCPRYWLKMVNMSFIFLRVFACLLRSRFYQIACESFNHFEKFGDLFLIEFRQTMIFVLSKLVALRKLLPFLDNLHPERLVRLLFALAFIELNL